MGDCKYCGESAGLFRRQHDFCAEQHDKGRKELIALISGVLTAQRISGSFHQQMDDITVRSYVSAAEQKKLLIDAWNARLHQALDDGILDTGEETRLATLQQSFRLTNDELESAGGLTKLVKASVLRDVLQGKIPQNVNVSRNPGINLQKTEQLVWLFEDCAYLEDRVRRHYVGSSQGVSVRIMKGVYYRIGAFKGHPVERTERVEVDKGSLALTTKNVYFMGAAKSLRIPYDKIVSFQPYSDGVGVMRDAANAKLQLFVTGDGWFSYNLAANLARL